MKHPLKKARKTAISRRVTRRQWASQINAAWRKSVAAIFETGRILIAAKASLEHGAWTAMVENDLRFNAQVGRMLMKIAEDQRLAKREIFRVLPPAYTTIYQLTKITDDKLLEQYVADGIISTSMTGREISTVVKRERRTEREYIGGQKIPEGKFGVVVEDFEWDDEVWSRKTGMDRHAANHYETATDAHTAQEIVNRTRERFECAADDCFLAMWSTIQHLAIAIDVMRLRGFDYVSHHIWGKDKIGLGRWIREKHDVLLLGVRGVVPCPAPGQQWDSLIMRPRERHSAKPECFLEMIEGYFPTWRKIELNRRGKARPGWSAWGNEAK